MKNKAVEIVNNDLVDFGACEAFFMEAEKNVSKHFDDLNIVVTAMDEAEGKMKAKIEEMEATLRRIKETRDRAKSIIKNEMVTIGNHEMLGNMFRALCHESEPKLIVDETYLPKDFYRIVQDAVPDKDMIKSYLKKGYQIPGCRLEPVHRLTLRVK